MYVSIYLSVGQYLIHMYVCMFLSVYILQILV